MNRDKIWEYIMAIRENVQIELRPLEEGHEVALIKQRKIVTSFEKKLFNTVQNDKNIELFIQSAIDCALGEYPYEDLISLYDNIKDN